MTYLAPKVLLFCLILFLGVAWAPLPLRAQAPTITRSVLGTSGQGRPIELVRIGDGPRKLVVVGATHGGAEANTHQLTLQLIAHFEENPQLVPPEVRLYFIPVLNPDGLALGSRFDGAGIDLNRNMNTNLDACPANDWRMTVFGARGLVSDTGGAFPESQPESRLIRNFLLDASGAIFLHSNAGLVFPASCEHPPSIRMAQIYAEAADYVYTRYWSSYQITGGMHDWAGSLGIAAITPELVTGDQPEFAQNLAGLLAVLESATETLPLPADRQVNAINVPAVIWRYWRAHNGEMLFGPPLAPADFTAGGLGQTFSRARLELHSAQVDTPYLVQPAPLGTAAFEARLFGEIAPAPADPASAPLYFEQTGHSLREAFLEFWQRYGGIDVFGYPISEEFTATALDGQVRTMQYFERAVFAYYPGDNSVRLEPLGTWQHQLSAVRAGWSKHQVR
jgi:predicted deacylase